jgi:hypothetical protein
VCIGTRLAIMEFTKCLTSGVGGKGCFGKNNTIVRFYTEYYKAVTKPSWGRNNDIRRGLREFDQGIARPLLQGLKKTAEETFILRPIFDIVDGIRKFLS